MQSDQYDDATSANSAGMEAYKKANQSYQHPDSLEQPLRSQFPRKPVYEAYDDNIGKAKRYVSDLLGELRIF